MTLTLSELKVAAAALPLQERLELADHITISTRDESDEIEREWEVVLDRRLAAIHSGSVRGIPADEVMKRIAER